jgi:hypothetical protein
MDLRDMRTPLTDSADRSRAIGVNMLSGSPTLDTASAGQTATQWPQAIQFSAYLTQGVRSSFAARV